MMLKVLEVKVQFSDDEVKTYGLTIKNDGDMEHTRKHVWVV